MSHREEKEAVNKLLIEALKVVADLTEREGVHFTMAVTEKLQEAVSNLTAIRERHAERNAILDNVESAALEYGMASKSGNAVMVVTAAGVYCRRALDLYNWESTIHTSDE